MIFVKADKLKKVACLILLVCLITNFLSVFSIQFVFGASNTIVVPEDFPTISMAVKNAFPYDTIFVKIGSYYENILIDKPLLLLGEDPDKTLIVGTSDLNGGNVITLASNNITVSGFTIKSAEYFSSKQYANGINIQGDNCSIVHNKIERSFWGILCAIQSSTLISQNNISANLKEGIRFYGGSLNRISENYITSNKASAIAIEGFSNIISENHINNNTRGIGVGTSYSVFFGNIISDHSESGFYFSGSNNIISSNMISNSEYGIYFPSDFAAPNNNLFYHNNFINNNQNIYVSSIYNLNYWDNTIEGNYWSNYASEYSEAKEVNDSGTSDTPYLIDFNNTDNHPLIDSFDVNNSKTIPTLPQPQQSQEGIVSLWNFDEVIPNLVTFDSVGSNHAILGSVSNNINYTPGLVQGKFGNCLSFDGWAYVYVPASPTLEIRDEVTIEAWIYIKEFKSVAYNNIVIQSTREDKSYPKRIMGIAVNGLEPENGASPPVGSLRGYVTTDTHGFNEIATRQAVINLKEWTHVVFVRSLKSGMALFVNGEKISSEVIQGIQNPEGRIKRSTYLYIGHDANCLLDEISISNVALESAKSSFWESLVLLVIVVGIGSIIISASLFIYFKKLKKV